MAKKVKVDYPSHFLHGKTVDFGGYDHYDWILLVHCVTEGFDTALPADRCIVYDEEPRVRA